MTCQTKLSRAFAHGRDDVGAPTSHCRWADRKGYPRAGGCGLMIMKAACVFNPNCKEPHDAS